ncbi:MAG: sterol desaturase [bacterium TMED198]|nr:MAG: sterol desaturase [bacterium TMED198]|tara:strand:+ start:1693 stop:2943 length:1251 start_codon:yes stop_codon:yes gene_type:complete
MSFYVKSLFFAVPSFFILILIEAIIAKKRGIVINNSADMISSLSSGLTNALRDGLKLSIAIVSYSWLVDSTSIYSIDISMPSILIGFIVLDFSGYWVHRLTHRVNILWNRHIIHHSSEEFNLSCALRQSISNTLKFSAIFMVPAALIGVPASIFAVIGPIHLFMQFWYHTRLIDKMGWLEQIIVTPSHHRVHHAINPEYIDKNYGQILIIWDKLFNTFQEEKSEIKPVYGTLTPVQTWNPILINFKHLWQIVKDAWNTKYYKDKFLIWFMPTGWRPHDVQETYPLIKYSNPYSQKKYNTKLDYKLTAWVWIAFVVSSFLTAHMFIVVESLKPFMIVLYTSFLIISIFSYSSLLDLKRYYLRIEASKVALGFFILSLNDFLWMGGGVLITVFIIFYLFFSIFFIFIIRSKSYEKILL